MQSGILGDVYEIRNTVNSYQRRDDWQAVIECRRRTAQQLGTAHH